MNTNHLHFGTVSLMINTLTQNFPQRKTVLNSCTTPPRVQKQFTHDNLYND